VSTLIQLGSCGSSWPQNTTPIQRLAAITPRFDKVILVDTAQDPNAHLKYDQYVCVSSINIASVYRVVKSNADENLIIWFGPSARISIIILILRLFFKFQYVVDLYDHENLSSGVALASGSKLRFLKYRALEYFVGWAANSSDLLVSAISESRYLNHPNRVKTINGVATKQLEKIADRGDLSIEIPPDNIVVCYVGLINEERVGLLQNLAAADYPVPVTLLLIGEHDSHYIKTLNCNATLYGKVTIVAPGFLPWSKAMNLVSQSDICLYAFPARPELDCVYPIKMGEYMELSKPIIATDSTAIREVFGGCPGVLRCSVDKPEDWALKVQYLALDEHSRQLLGEENHKFARESLDWSNTQTDLISKLDLLIGLDS